MNWTKIMECVPNFSEGRDLQKIDEIAFRSLQGYNKDSIPKDLIKRGGEVQ